MHMLFKWPLARGAEPHMLHHNAAASLAIARAYFPTRCSTLPRMNSGSPPQRWTPLHAVQELNDAACPASDDEIATQEQYVTHCQQHYGIAGFVDFTLGPGNLPHVTLRSSGGAQAKVCLHGATITSWLRDDGSEMLYLRDTNKFDGVTPIAGGIGLAWPQLGPGTLPLHGFLRNLHWSVMETSAYEDDRADPRPAVTLYADSASVGPDTWPHSFEARYSVSLERPDPPELHPRDLARLRNRLLDHIGSPPHVRAAIIADAKARAAVAAKAARGDEPVPKLPSVLRCALQVTNRGDDEFVFTGGLLTHLATIDIRENSKFVKLMGLGGKYMLDYGSDAMRPTLAIEQNDFVFFNPDSGVNVDRLYVDCDDEGQIMFCPGTQHYMEIRHREGFNDLEVLHPAGSAPEVARRCVCLASARKARPVRLAPGASWQGEVRITAHNKYWTLPSFEKADPSTVPVPPRVEALPPRRSTGDVDYPYDEDDVLR